MRKITFLIALLIPFIGFSQFNVTFQVDMNQYSGSYNAVEVFGTFNGFAGGVSIMTDANSDGVYDITIPIAAGTIEFLYAVDTGTFNYVVEDLTGTQPFCTVTSGQFTNRTFTISADTTYSVVCWEACVDCANAPSNSNVTFQVDMSQYSGTFTEVNLNGTFNNFCGSCAVMTDANNDMIYELEVTVPNDTIEWLFTVDGFTDAESFSPGDPCTKTTIDGSNTFVNRVMVPSADTVLPDVCWNSCVDCASVGIEEEWVSGLTISPNPSTGIVQLQGQIFGVSEYSISVFDVNGKQISIETLNSTELNKQLDLSGLSNGLYLIKIDSELGQINEKVLIQN